MDSTAKGASPAIVGDPTPAPVTAPLTQGQPIHAAPVVNDDQDASGSEDENSDDEWDEEEEEDYADEDDFPTWDGGIPRAKLEKPISGDPSGPKKKVTKKDTGTSKSDGKADGKTDDPTDDKTDENQRKDGASGSGSSALQTVAGQGE